jgi:hypothetical protein
MDLQTEPDTYSPSVNHLGNYIDVVPSFNNIKNGLRCPCGSRKGKTYITNCLFSSHTKTKIHQTWLENLNLNKSNYFIESENLKAIVKDQRIVIAQQDRDLQNKNLTIDYLTQQLINNKNTETKTVDNLLEFD